MVEPGPGAALEVVEPQLHLELLVRLLAHPAGLDRRDQDPERRAGGVVGQVVLALASGAPLPDQPERLARQAQPAGHGLPTWRGRAPTAARRGSCRARAPGGRATAGARPPPGAARAASPSAAKYSRCRRWTAVASPVARSRSRAYARSGSSKRNRACPSASSSATTSDRSTRASAPPARRPRPGAAPAGAGAGSVVTASAASSDRAAGEDGQAGEERPLPLVEQVVAPAHGGEGLLPGRDGAVAALEQAEAVPEPLQQVPDREDAGVGGRQLERQREAVQSAGRARPPPPRPRGAR